MTQETPIQYFKITEKTLVKYLAQQLNDLEEILADARQLNKSEDVPTGVYRDSSKNQLVMLGVAVECKEGEEEDLTALKFTITRRINKTTVFAYPHEDNITLLHYIPVKYLYLFEQNPLFDYKPLSLALLGDEDLVFNANLLMIDPKTNKPVVYITTNKLPEDISIPKTTMPVTQKEFDQAVTLSKKQAKQNLKIIFD